jgi:hypothetical protein
MFRTLMAGSAIAGALTLGAAGVAGAATTPAGGATGATGASAATLCSKLPTIVAKVNRFEGAVAARLPKAEAREAKARAAGHTKFADAIAKRITRVQAREKKLDARLAKIEAKCGSPSSTGNTGSSSL